MLGKEIFNRPAKDSVNGFTPYGRTGLQGDLLRPTWEREATRAERNASAASWALTLPRPSPPPAP